MSAQPVIQFVHLAAPPADPKLIGPTGAHVLNQRIPLVSCLSLRILIVDDEPIARKVLREELELIDGVEIVAEAHNGKKALDQIAEHKPDLVLLDLQMPEMGGLEVARRLKHGSHLPAIVIVTAYDAFAIKAFEAGAIDYLLKPVGQERLAQAIERARRLSGKQIAERVAQLQEIGDASVPQRVKKIVGRLGAEYFLLNADEIYAFQAEGELVWIITAKRKYLATQALKGLQHRLASTSFRRIHRNALVNVDQVRKMSALSSQRWLITLSNGQEFIASKRQAHEVRQLLNW
jgi:two-component system LytT family response regulator